MNEKSEGERREFEPESWRAIQFVIPWSNKGMTPRRWLKYAWGMDIWFGDLPFCKTILLVNVLIWIAVLLCR